MDEPQESKDQIFICYRRDDSAWVTGRIYDRLVQKFGEEAVFKDIDSIPLGKNFKQYIDSIIGKCTVVIVVIGDQWLDSNRIDDPNDYVRLEIESALRRDIPVIPLLVQNASMPPEEVLPQSLRELRYRHGIPISNDPHFHVDMNRLIKSLEGILIKKPLKRREPSTRTKRWPSISRQKKISLLLVSVVIIVLGFVLPYLIRDKVTPNEASLAGSPTQTPSLPAPSPTQTSTPPTPSPKGNPSAASTSLKPNSKKPRQTSIASTSSTTKEEPGQNAAEESTPTPSSLDQCVRRKMLECSVVCFVSFGRKRTDERKKCEDRCKNFESRVKFTSECLE